MNVTVVAIFRLDTRRNSLAEFPFQNAMEPLERARMGRMKPSRMETEMARVWVAGWALREWV